MGDTMKVHKVVQDGFCKEGSSYDKSRPAYADELLFRVASSLYKGKPEDVRYSVLELGAGTGKFTRGLWPRLEKGSLYLATDPSEGFLKVLKEQTPEVDIQVCTALDIPLSDNSVQNIVCATAFHWFADHENLKEMTRVLVPGGRLFLVWNSKQWQSGIDWLDGVEELLISDYNYSGIPRALTKEWKTAVETFPPLKCVEYTHLPGIYVKGDKVSTVDHFASISVVASLSSDHDLNIAKEKIKTVLDKHFKDDEEIQMPYISEFYCAEKL